MQENVAHREEKKLIFFTRLIKKVFMTCLLCGGKSSLDECNSFKEKGLQERNTALYSSRNCVMTASFQYLLATTQEIVRKEKKGKVTKKRHPTSLHDYKTEKPKHKLEKDRVEKDNE